MTQTVPPPRSFAVETCTHTANLKAEARAAAKHIAESRQFEVGGIAVRDDVIPVTAIKSPGASLVCFFRIRLVTLAGRLIEDTLLPVRLPIDKLQRRLGRKETRALVESLIAQFGSSLQSHAQRYAQDRIRAVSRETATAIASAAGREVAIAHDLAAQHSPAVQAGLFDGRALKRKRAGDEHRETIRRENDARARLLNADANVRLAQPPELALLLLCCRG